MGVQKINQDLYIGDTGKQLKDIKNNADNLIFDNERFTENGLTYCRIGKYNESYDLYFVQGDLGFLPNQETKKYTWQLSSRFVAWHSINFLAYSGVTKINLPYLYPSTQYINYWITLETIGNDEVTVIAGTNRSIYRLWLYGIALLTKKLDNEL